MGLVMLTKMFPGPVQASLHCGHAGREDRRDFGITEALLDKGADAGVRARDGRSAASIAKTRKRAEVSALLPTP